MISPVSFKNAFLGIIPSSILTASADGTPNVAYLSQVYLLDEKKLALTTQFFNKTKTNLSENPYCTVRVYEPETFCAYEIEAKYTHTETCGEMFEKLSKKFEAIADYSGASHFFKLQALEILEVVNIEVIGNEARSSEELAVTPSPRARQIDFESLQKVCERVSSAQTLEELFDSILKAIDLEFGLRHSMILMKQDSSDRLYTISTRGYDQAGVGSEVRFGEGVIGRAAQMKVPFAHASLTRELLYARWATEQNAESTQDAIINQAIPLPGLKTSRSQLAVPIILRNEVLGVLFAESENIYEFRESDESILKTLSHFLALAIQNLQMSHDFEITPQPLNTAPVKAPQVAQEKLIFSYFQKEDCILLNGEYLIRNVPARILWRMLNLFKNEGKTEFTNREFRMDAWLQLPEVKDNLETRMILLRKRLEKKCPSIAIISSGRGRLTFIVSGEITLCEN